MQVFADRGQTQEQQAAMPFEGGTPGRVVGDEHGGFAFDGLVAECQRQAEAGSLGGDLQPVGILQVVLDPLVVRGTAQAEVLHGRAHVRQTLVPAALWIGGFEQIVPAVCAEMRMLGGPVVLTPSARKPVFQSGEPLFEVRARLLQRARLGEQRQCLSLRELPAHRAPVAQRQAAEAAAGPAARAAEMGQ